MRPSDSIWILLLAIVAAFTVYTFIQDEIRGRRLRQSLNQLLKEPTDPEQIRRVLAENPQFASHFPSDFGLQLDHLANRLSAEKAVLGTLKEMESAFPAEMRDPARMREEMAAHPELVANMVKAIQPLTGEPAPGSDKLRELVSALQNQSDQDIQRYAAAIPLTLRPKAANIEIGSRRLIGIFVITLLLASWLFVGAGYRHHPVATALTEVVLIAIWAFVYVRRSLYLRRATVFVDDTQAGYTTVWGRKKAVDRSLIGSLYLSKQVVTSARGGSSLRRRVFLVGKNERPLLRLSATYWSWDDMRTLAATLGVPLRGTWTTDETGDELRRRLPGSISWWAAHPNIFWTLVMIPLIPALILLLVALSS